MRSCSAASRALSAAILRSIAATSPSRASFSEASAFRRAWLFCDSVRASTACWSSRLAGEAHAQLGELGASDLGLRLRILDREGQLRIGQLEDDRVRADGGARLKHDAVDAAVGGRRYPADLFRDQGADTTHLAQHLTTLDGVDPDRGALH